MAAYIHWFQGENMPDADRAEILSGDEAIHVLALRIEDGDVGGYLGTIEITEDRVGLPVVRFINMEPQASARAWERKRRDAA